MLQNHQTPKKRGLFIAWDVPLFVTGSLLRACAIPVGTIELRLLASVVSPVGISCPQSQLFPQVFFGRSPSSNAYVISATEKSRWFYWRAMFVQNGTIPWNTDWHGDPLKQSPYNWVGTHAKRLVKKFPQQRGQDAIPGTLEVGTPTFKRKWWVKSFFLDDDFWMMIFTPTMNNGETQNLLKMVAKD